jgi:broad specificity phosphatase PhoE
MPIVEGLTLRSGLTLYFVRHGETDWNATQRYQGQTDIPLNDKGRGQAARNGRALADHLRAKAKSMHYVASPLSRTVETMQILRHGLGLSGDDFARDARLKEQHFGDWEGIVWGDLPKLDPQGFAARKADTWNWAPHGGENYAMLQARVETWLAELTEDTVAVAHGNVGRVVRGLVLRLEKQSVTKLEAPQDRVLKLTGGSADWI